MGVGTFVIGLSHISSFSLIKISPICYVMHHIRMKEQQVYACCRFLSGEGDWIGSIRDKFFFVMLHIK